MAGKARPGTKPSAPAAPRGGAYLVFGKDEFLVKERVQALISELAPQAIPDFHIVHHDGPQAAAQDIIRDLRNMPLLPGPKVVVVEDCPYFAPQKGDTRLLEKLAAAAHAGGDRDLQRLVRQWCGQAGVAIADLARAPVAWPEGASELADALDANAQDAVARAARALAAQETGGGSARQEAEVVLEYLAHGVPPGHFLILWSVSVHRGLAAFKQFEALGKTLDTGGGEGFTTAAKREDARARVEFIMESAKRAGGVIPQDAASELERRAGREWRLLRAEADKLVCYAGGKPATVRDVQTVVPLTREEPFFIVNEALRTKNARSVIHALHELDRAGGHPIASLGAMAKELHRLWFARLLLEGPLQGEARHVGNSRNFESAVWPKIQARPEWQAELPDKPYACMKTMEACQVFSVAELERGLKLLHLADRKLKSSRLDNLLVLERAVVGWLGGR